MSAKSLHMVILTPESTLFDGPAASVSLPGTLGPFVVLPGHAAIISTLEKGKIVVGDASFAIRRGVAKVKDDEITVCAEI